METRVNPIRTSKIIRRINRPNVWKFLLKVLLVEYDFCEKIMYFINIVNTHCKFIQC